MDYQSIITICVLLAVMVAFFTEKVPPHMAAMGAMAALLATGILSSADALSVFSNSAPITIACMCILSASLHSTGIIDMVGEKLVESASTQKILTIFLMMFGVVFLSAFMNNTPLVIIMTPVIIHLAEKMKEYPSKYLIPLSYMAILGGTCTLIGTSTNILVNSIAQKYGQEPFTMFEITGVGLILTVVGGTYLALIGRHLLPERSLLQKELIDEDKRKKYTMEALVPSHSKLIGHTINELEENSDISYEIIDLVRNERGSKGGLQSLLKSVASAIEGSKDKEGEGRSTLRDTKLKEGDKIILKTEIDDLIEIRKQFGLEFGNEDDGFAEVLTSRKTAVAEAVVLHNSTFIGKRVEDLRIRRRYGAYIIAIFRGNQDITSNLGNVRFQEGDIILLEGPEKELELLFEQEVLQSLTSESKHIKLNKKKAAISIASIVGVVGISAFGVMDISGLSIIGALVVIFTGCINQDKAYHSIEWRILMMIFGMLALSLAIDSTGIGESVVGGLATLLSGYGPWVVLGAVYFLTSICTEMISNNAVAVLLTPIVIGLAASMGVDARPFLVAVMLGASASFATPIGYQTNTFVYNAGNYRYRDFLKVGVPMNILIAITAIAVIPFFWSF